MTNQDFVYSNQDCCNNCNRLKFDITKGYLCEHATNLKPYHRACIFFDRRLQGFGE